MSNQKLKTSSFSNMGGINSKISPYLTGPQEFINLVNIDFQTPGSLTKRWGSTAYFGQTLSTRITGLYEYEKTSGQSYVMVTGNSSIYVGTGTSLSLVANFLGITTVYNGITIAASPTYQVGIAATFWNTGLTYYLGGTYPYDFEVYNNILYACNGNNIWKFNGSDFLFFGLPTPGKAFLLNNGYSLSYMGSGTSYGFNKGIYAYAYGYVTSTGLYGPASLLPYYAYTYNGSAFAGATGIKLNWNLAPANTVVDANYGITAIAVYRALISGSTTVPTDTKAITSAQYVLLSPLMPFGATEYIDSNPIDGATLAPTGMNIKAEIWSTLPIYQVPGGIAPSENVFAPRFIEIYNNQMFYAGELANPSRVYFSDIDNPESIQPESTFEVKTSDGDIVTGMKSYLSSLYIFKKNSFHRLSGQDYLNFAFAEVSNQYGCLSNRAIAVFKTTMFFLDRKGIIAFNGANIEIASNKIDPIFRRMNVDAAIDNAVMTYDKVRNEVLCEIPIDGSTTNNFTVVFDILNQSWSTYEGVRSSSSAIIRGRLNEQTYLTGDYNGLISNFGASYLSDNGSAFTCLIKTRFFTELNPSTTKQFRRLYLNVDAVTGSTSALTVELFKNYESNILETRTTYQNPYQTRLDFGIPATSLGVQISNYSSLDTFRLHGFTVEYRMQRKVQDLE